MDAALKEKWLEALRSDEYEQAQGVLYSGQGYCCLGVLCEIDPRVEFAESGIAYYGDDADGSELPTSYRMDLGIDKDTENHLIQLNDDESADFAEIAKWIEENL